MEAMDGYCTYRDYLDRPRARDFVADVAPVTVSCNNNNNKNGIQTLFRQQLQMERGGEPDLQGREPIFPTTTRRRSTGRRWHWKSASSYPSCCPAASFLQRGRKPDAAAGARGKEARLLATSWSRRQGVGRTWQPLLLPSGQDRTRNAPEPEKNGGVACGRNPVVLRLTPHSQSFRCALSSAASLRGPPNTDVSISYDHLVVIQAVGSSESG